MMKTAQSRRNFLKSGALLSLLGLGVGKLASSFPLGDVFEPEPFPEPVIGKYQLPALPFAYDALEPYIDRLTMEIHHSKHHQAYIDNLNKAIEANAQAMALSLDDLCRNISKFPVVIRNNAGGHYNHTFFWKILTSEGSEKPVGKLASAIDDAFGSFDNFKLKFTETAMSRFGSGWAWLVSNKGKLSIGSTTNQDCPLMDIAEFKGTPVIGLDVWEHAYYLKHQNRRAEYITAFWNVLNWEEAERNYQASR